MDTSESNDSGAPAARATRVLIVDDHQALAASLAQVLDAEPDLFSVGVAGSVAEALQMVRQTRPDVVLLDHRLPDGDGVDAIPELRAAHSGVRLVVLTATSADSVLAAAVEAGASGFLSKSRSLEEVTSAVRAAAAGEAVISPELLARLLPRFRRSTPGGSSALTEREREVLELLSQGLTNSAIASTLFVSVNTVRNHVANMSNKLGAHSKLEVLAIAVREGLLPGA